MRRISSQNPKVNHNFPIEASLPKIRKFLKQFDLPPDTLSHATLWVQILQSPVVTMEKAMHIADNEDMCIQEVGRHLEIMAEAGLIVLWTDIPDWEEHLHRGN